MRDSLSDSYERELLEACLRGERVDTNDKTVRETLTIAGVFIVTVALGTILMTAPFWAPFFIQLH